MAPLCKCRMCGSRISKEPRGDDKDLDDVLELLEKHPGTNARELSVWHPGRRGDRFVRRMLRRLERAGKVKRGKSRPCRFTAYRAVTWWPKECLAEIRWD